MSAKNSLIDGKGGLDGLDCSWTGGELGVVALKSLKMQLIFNELFKMIMHKSVA